MRGDNRVEKAKEVEVINTKALKTSLGAMTLPYLYSALEFSELAKIYRTYSCPLKTFMKTL